MLASEGHSRSVERRARDCVRIAKESQPARNTHELSGAERGTDQDSERKPASGGDSLPVERRARDWSGQRKKVNLRGALTLCRAQSEELVRTAKECQLARDTHVLSGAGEGLVSTAKERKRGGLTFCQAQSKGLVSTAKRIPASE
jgi:hypothetical protein